MSVGETAEGNGHGRRGTARYSPPLTFNASDLRQYVYCRRVIYFRYCLPVRPPPTYKMAEGKLQHERVEELERRRSLRAYGLADGERVFDVRLASERLGVVGTLDMVVVRRHEVIPVEFKHTEARPSAARFTSPRLARPRANPGSRRAHGEEEDDTLTRPVDGLSVALHHKYQLAAYALLAEEHWQLPARRCFVYFVAARRAGEVAIAPGVRDYTRRLLREMERLVMTQQMPGANRHKERCRDCEYRRFCNDVD